MYVFRLYVYACDIKVHAAFPKLVTLLGPVCIPCVYSSASVYVICASLCQGE